MSIFLVLNLFTTE